MANPQVGEVSFEAGGKTYTFKFGTYARALLERRVKMPVTKFFKREESEFGTDDILQIFIACLEQRHKLSEEDVAELLDAIGMEKAAEIMAEATALAAGGNKGVANGSEGPQTARAGIGTN